MVVGIGIEKDFKAEDWAAVRGRDGSRRRWRSGPIVGSWGSAELISARIGGEGGAVGGSE